MTFRRDTPLPTCPLCGVVSEYKPLACYHQPRDGDQWALRCPGCNTAYHVTARINVTFTTWADLDDE